MKLIACIVVRLHSKRLPMKAFRELSVGKNGITTLELLILRAKRADSFDKIVLCTSENPEDQPLKAVADKHNIEFYAGSERDVSERLAETARIYGCGAIARLTGDNPLVSFERIKLMLGLLNSGYDYIRYDKVPVGFSPEIFTLAALEKVRKSMNLEESEYMMLYLYNPAENNCLLMRINEGDYSHFSVTVDTEEDLNRVQSVINDLGDRTMSNPGYEKVLLDVMSTHGQAESNYINLNSEVKYPENRIITFKDYLIDMENRRVLSDKLIVNAKH